MPIAQRNKRKMPERDPARDKAREMWLASGGTLSCASIAKALEIPFGRVTGWKQRDKWNDYDRLTFMFGHFETAPEIRDAVRARLRAFPDVCQKAKTATGEEAIALECEINIIKSALTAIKDDPYYHVVRDLYLHGRRLWDIVADAELSSKRNYQEQASRLIDTLALRLYGVVAQWNLTNNS